MPVIDDMIRIYSYDVDFQRKVQPGDSFDVFYAGEDEGPTSPKRTRCCLPRSLSAARPRNTTASRPPTTPSSTTTTRPARARRSSWCASPSTTPSCAPASAAAAIRSSAMSKMHTGVDWATAYGTPIFASGNGVVEKVGSEGGYGKYIRIKHNNGYETAYGHMSAFAKGMEVGKRVRQGQVIGFVGSTGMSTGAARPLRNPGQRPLRRPDARQAAARPLARRPDDGRLREGTRPARRHDERPWRRTHLRRQRRPVAGHEPLSHDSATDACTITKTIPIAVRPNDTAISGSSTSIAA